MAHGLPNNYLYALNQTRIPHMSLAYSKAKQKKKNGALPFVKVSFGILSFLLFAEASSMFHENKHC